MSPFRKYAKVTLKEFCSNISAQFISTFQNWNLLTWTSKPPLPTGGAPTPGTTHNSTLSQVNHILTSLYSPRGRYFQLFLFFGQFLMKKVFCLLPVWHTVSSVVCRLCEGVLWPQPLLPRPWGWPNSWDKGSLWITYLTALRDVEPSQPTRPFFMEWSPGADHPQPLSQRHFQRCPARPAALTLQRNTYLQPLSAMTSTCSLSRSAQKNTVPCSPNKKKSNFSASNW